MTPPTDPPVDLASYQSAYSSAAAAYNDQLQKSDPGSNPTNAQLEASVGGTTTTTSSFESKLSNLESQALMDPRTSALAQDLNTLTQDQNTLVLDLNTVVGDLQQIDIAQQGLESVQSEVATENQQAKQYEEQSLQGLSPESAAYLDIVDQYNQEVTDDNMQLGEAQSQLQTAKRSLSTDEPKVGPGLQQARQDAATVRADLGLGPVPAGAAA
jgi:hypothetical protein